MGTLHIARRGFLVGMLAMSLASFAHAQSGSAEIKIGFVNPTTGPFGTLGKYARKGMDLALEQAQNRGALKGLRFTVVERDSAGKAADAVRYARELLTRESVDVLMGGLSSAECMSIQKMVAEEKIAYLPTSGCWADGFSSPSNVNKYSFRVTANNQQRNFAFAEWLLKNVGKTWYVIYSDFAYGQSGAKAFQEAIAASGGKIVGTIAVPFGTTDMAAYVSKIDTSAEGLYFILAGRDAILALQESAAQGLDKKMKFAGMQSLIVAENFPKMPESAEGLSFIGAYPRDINGAIDTPANRSFREAYLKKYPNDVVGLNAFEAYQATNALLQGIEKSGFRGRKDTDKLVGALDGATLNQSENFPAGTITLRKGDNQGVGPLYIARVKDGKEEVIHMIPASVVGKYK